MIEKRNLGKTGIEVTSICLGTMTWGEQNTESDAHQQLTYACDERGVNFVDAAELYPIPPKAETQGRTEQYIGSWLKKRGQRHDLVIATKACGPGVWVNYFRGGPRHNKQHLVEAVDASLRGFKPSTSISINCIGPIVRPTSLGVWVTVMKMTPTRPRSTKPWPLLSAWPRVVKFEQSVCPTRPRGGS